MEGDSLSASRSLPVFETGIPGVPPPRRGKVRDLYDLGDRLLLVATDRLSAFDVVLPTPVPDKGAVLNQISLFWFERTRDLVENHVLSADEGDLPPFFREAREILRGRFLIARKAKPLPVECIVRGYLAGSGWKEYRERGSVCGIPLPKGLRESERLPEPLFTPSTKAAEGHDENIPFEEAVRLLGDRALTERVRDLSLAVYARGRDLAEARGILVADTKFEFGLWDGRLILIDEVLTPDSSRFWPADGYAPGRPQPSFDKQYVRDYLLSLKNWNRTPPGPALPEEVVAGTRARYVEAYERLTGRKFGDF